MWRFLFFTDLPKNANLLKEALTGGFSCWPGSSGNWSIWMARRNPRFRRSRRGRGRPVRTRRSRWTPSTAGLPTVRTCGPWQCRTSAGWCYRERPCKDIKVLSITLPFSHTNKYAKTRTLLLRTEMKILRTGKLSTLFHKANINTLVCLIIGP